MGVFSYNMMRYTFTIVFLLLSTLCFAGKISGTVTSEKGELLPYSSITVKGKKLSTSANNQGVFFLELEPGTYTIICRHVGYERQEKTVTITSEEVKLDFVLKEQQVSLKEVVVNAGAEDPAYAIIRQAIKKRKTYLDENEVYECEVYSKGVMNLRNYPTKFFGQKVDFEDGDTSKRKMIYLSETVSKFSVDKPNKIKIDVLSTRVSGQSDGFGFAGARFLPFYENMVQVSSAINPRGFVSPIAENALSFYKYKYEGAFSEEGKLINKIKVIPKRKYEPCFSGYINIVEDEWRIHSLELMITKENQMNFGDTLRIEQLYQMMGVNQWVMQSQVLYPSIKFFGFDACGSFANVYRNFNLNPAFEKKYFNSTILKYEQGSNKKPVTYWDSIRPLQLTAEEMRDYVKKDSLEQRRKDPSYLDSIDRISNKIKPGNIFYSGKTFSRQSKKMSYTLPSLLQVVSFNTVEGWVADVPVTIRKQYTDRKSISIAPTIRYGFSSEQFYSWLTLRYNYGKKYFSNITVSGGKRIFQLNSENPVEPLQNTIGSLFYKNNFLKLYRANYGRINFSKGVGAGVNVSASFQYQDRKPLENTTDFSFLNKDSQKVYRPNYPSEITYENFKAHQAAVFTIGISFQPKARYIEFPDRVINIGSRWPNFNLQYTMGINGLLGSDVNYDKWQLTIRDNLNMKLLGTLNYRLLTGGFLNNKNVQLPDLKHFPGNRYISAEDYTTSFQLPQYYQFSNNEKLYGAAFAEHHFNGFITNKIPGFKKLNWTLVGGASAVWLRKQTYVEWHAGLENIFKILRVDVVAGYRNGYKPVVEYRIGTRINISSNND
jgi:hypothetical protein